MIIDNLTENEIINVWLVRRKLNGEIIKKGKKEMKDNDSFQFKK